MPKNKDPAVLFYTSDFLVGVMGLTMAERGQYITLLCMQHQKGHLSAKDIELAVGKVSPDVLKKFETDEAGNYYNETMESAAKQRASYIESRRKSSLARFEKKKSDAPYEASYDNTTMYRGENENENITIDKDITKNNISFSFSNTTTTTVDENAPAREDIIKIPISNEDLERIRRENDFEKKIKDYFKDMEFISSAEMFIQYNTSRGWRGHNGIDLTVDENWAEYANEWERKEHLRLRGY